MTRRMKRNDDKRSTREGNGTRPGNNKDDQRVQFSTSNMIYQLIKIQYIVMAAHPTLKYNMIKKYIFPYI